MQGSGVDFYSTNELLSDEERLTKAVVSQFLEKEIKPLIKQAWQNEQKLDFRMVAKRFGELGLLGTYMPEKYDCPESDYTTYGLVCQEVERVDSSLRSFIAVSTGLVMFPIWKFGSEEQKKKWLPKLAKGSTIGCFGLTESEHGSDPSGMETTAEACDNYWIINGSKSWITEADIADIAIIWARDKKDKRVKAFIVENDADGFSQSAIREKGSMRAGGVGEVGLIHCKVAEDSRLPKTVGLKSAFECLDQARYGISWGALGAAIDCYETALTYVSERKQFGKPLASFQMIQKKLADMLTAITKGQLICLRLSSLMNNGKATPEQISLAKMNNVRVARFCARTSREMIGANGISLDYSPIRHMANIESVYTYEGTDDMHTLILGRYITGYNAFKNIP